MRKEFSLTIENESEKSKNNSEKSSINKIIGADSEEERREIKDKFAKRFREQKFEDFKELEEIEIEKTPKQIQIINFVNGEINKLLEKHGLPKFDIPADNVHLLKEDDYYRFKKYKDLEELKELKNTEPGLYAPGHQCVFINNGFRSIKNDLGFASAVFHEHTHFNTFQSFRNLERAITFSQMGLALKLKSAKILFNNLNEGLTAELEKRFYKNVLRKHPLFSKKIKENEKITRKDQKNKRINFNIDDVFDIEIIKNKFPKSLINKSRERNYFRFGYSEQREILNTLIEKLYSKNKDKFDDKEQVFDLFVKSAFTGKLNWGRLVNQTFGKGAFKKLAQLDENVEELEKFVNNLK